MFSETREGGAPACFTSVCVGALSSEFESEIEVKVGLLGAVAVAQGGTYGTEHRVIVVGGLHAEHGAAVEQVSNLVGLLGSGHA